MSLISKVLDLINIYANSRIYIKVKHKIKNIQHKKEIFSLNAKITGKVKKRYNLLLLLAIYKYNLTIKSLKNFKLKKNMTKFDIIIILGIFLVCELFIIGIGSVLNYPI